MPVERRSPTVVTLGSQKKGARLPAGDDRATTSPGTVELPPAFAGNEKGLPDKVFKLRKKLYIKAKQEPKVRFYTLFGLVLRRDVLEAAWDQVARNHGGPGVDGVRIEDVRRGHGGVDGFLDKIEASLRSRRYKPQAVKRVMIPKANGGERPLGIPTVRDRVVQTALKLILEPIAERGTSWTVRTDSARSGRPLAPYRMRENRLSGLMRGERVALHGMRILSHVRGNPETDVGRSLNRATRSSTLPPSEGSELVEECVRCSCCCSSLRGFRALRGNCLSP